MAVELPTDYFPCSSETMAFDMLKDAKAKKWKKVKQYLEEEGIDPNVGSEALDVREAQR